MNGNSSRLAYGQIIPSIFTPQVGGERYFEKDHSAMNNHAVEGIPDRIPEIP